MKLFETRQNMHVYMVILSYLILAVRLGICFYYAAKVDGPDGWLDSKATAWSRQCAKVSIDHCIQSTNCRTLEMSTISYSRCITLFKLRPWLGHLPVPMSKTRRNDVQKRKDGMGKQMVKVHQNKSKGTVTVLLGKESHCYSKICPREEGCPNNSFWFGKQLVVVCLLWGISFLLKKW